MIKNIFRKWRYNQFTIITLDFTSIELTIIDMFMFFCVYGIRQPFALHIDFFLCL